MSRLSSVNSPNRLKPNLASLAATWSRPGRGLCLGRRRGHDVERDRTLGQQVTSARTPLPSSARRETSSRELPDGPRAYRAQRVGFGARARLSTILCRAHRRLTVVYGGYGRGRDRGLGRDSVATRFAQMSCDTGTWRKMPKGVLHNRLSPACPLKPARPR